VKSTAAHPGIVINAKQLNFQNFITRSKYFQLCLYYIFIFLNPTGKNTPTVRPVTPHPNRFSTGNPTPASRPSHRSPVSETTLPSPPHHPQQHI
jgi:hypothetical protein